MNVVSVLSIGWPKHDEWHFFKKKKTWGPSPWALTWFQLVSAACKISFGYGLPSKRKDTLCSNSNNQKALTRLIVSIVLQGTVKPCTLAQSDHLWGHVVT